MKRSMKLLLAVEILAIFAVSTTISNGLYSITMGVLVGFILYEHYGKEKRGIVWPNKMFHIAYWPFFVLVILSSLLIGYQDSLQFALQLTQWSVVTFWVFYIAFQWYFSEKLIISGVAFSLWTLCIFALQQFIQLPLGTRITGSFAQPNHFCMILILSVPFLILYTAWKTNVKVFRLLLVIISVVSCVVVAFTGSRGGIIGLCLGGFIYLLIQTLYVRKWSLHKLLISYITVLAVVLCIGTTYYMTFSHHVSESHQQVGMTRSYDNQRLLFLQSSYHMWQDHKLFGVGLKHWEKEYYEHYISPKAYEKGITMPHNTYASMFSMTGFLGGSGFILFTFGMFVYLCYTLKKNPNDLFLNALLWSFLAIMIHGLVDVGILNRYAMILYSAYLGIGLASIAYNKQSEPQENQ